MGLLVGVLGCRVGGHSRHAAGRILYFVSVRGDNIIHGMEVVVVVAVSRLPVRGRYTGFHTSACRTRTIIRIVTSLVLFSLPSACCCLE